MKKFAFFLAAICCAVSLYAADCKRSGNCGYDEENLIAWAYNEGILSFSGSGVMASYTATDKAPWDCWKDEVTTVVFEHNVSFIGEYAFNGFSHLETVQFPRAIYPNELAPEAKPDSFVIGKYAFAGCTALQEVIIPANVKYIRKNAFNGSGLERVYLLGATPFEFLDYGGYDVPFNACASLEHIYVPAGSLSDYQAYWSANAVNAGFVPLFAEGAPTLATVGEEVVDGDFTYTVLSVTDRTMSVKRTSGVEFRFKDKIVYKGMVWDVKELAPYAFANAQFDRYDVPTYITKIGDYAFSGCSNLYVVVVSDSVPDAIGEHVFDGLPADYTINIPTDPETSWVEAYKAAWPAYADHINKGVAPYAIDVEIDGLTYYLRGYGLKTAQVTGIAGNPSEITIPATVEYEGYTYAVNSIEYNAFEGNTSVEKLTLAVDLNSESLHEPGFGITVTMPSKEQLDAALAAGSITQEQYDALLYSAGQLSSIFSRSPDFGDEHSYGPDNTTLKEVVIAEGVTRIPAGLFGGLTGIEKVDIASTVSVIENDAFVNCDGIQSVISRAASPANLSDLYRVFPRKNDTRLLYVSYADRQHYIDMKWNTFFVFDEEISDNQVNINSLESENANEEALHSTLEAMKAAAEGATASVVTTNLTIERTLYKDGYLNTICLPFDLASLDGTPLEGGEIFEFDHANVENNALDMVIVPTNHIEAGKPYFIRWANTGEVLRTLEFKNIQITQTTGLSVQGSEGNVEFKGHLGMKHIDKVEEGNSNYSNLYLEAGDKFRWPSDNYQTSMSGFRAYFRVYVGGTSGSAPHRGMGVRIVFGEKTATGIDNTEVLNGAYKMVENGQLVIIRDGVRYNAAGQIVK